MISSSDLLNISQKFGTPIYVYDGNLIQQKFKNLQKHFQDFPHVIHYAMKANENPEILKILKKNGAKIDAVSTGEIQRALDIGFPPEDIIFTPSFPDFDEIDFAIAQNIHLHAGELYILDYLLKNYPKLSIGLRINPAYSIEGNQKIATAHQNSKFGIPLTDLDIILQKIKGKLRVESLHIHTGSDVKTWEDLAYSADVLFDLLPKFPDVKYLDLGSGFKVKYQKNDNSIDLNAYAHFIKSRLNDIPRNLTIHFEPGKYLVSEAGYLLVKINGLKQGYQKKFAGVNSGFHHLIRPMYYDAYHEIVNLSNPNGKLETYDIVGQLCEEDTLAYDRQISEIKPQDILAIKNAGAYGFSMSSHYNLHAKPKEILVLDNQIKDISQTCL